MLEIAGQVGFRLHKAEGPRVQKAGDGLLAEAALQKRTDLGNRKPSLRWASLDGVNGLPDELSKLRLAG